MLPTEEDYAAWDKEEEEFVIGEVLRRVGYNILSALYPDAEAFKKKELCEGDGQCSFDCVFWDNCKYKS